MGRPARELTPHASLRHFLGAELRHWRQAAELSHARLGERVNYSGALIAKVEKAQRTPTPALAQACDRVLGTGGVLSRLVELIEAAEQEDGAPVAAQWPGDVWLLAGHRPTVGGESARGVGPVNRFEFLVSALGAGAGSFFESESRLGREDVTTWRRNLARLHELDAQYGGAGVYGLALQSLQQLRRVLRRTSYSTSVGEELHTVAGELTSLTGWLAFDAGWQAEARYWWLEASHTAQLNGDNRVSVTALRSLPRQASEVGRSGEAIELAQAAQQAAKAWGTPRLHSNLLTLEAFAHSQAGDERASWDALQRSGALLGRGSHDDDPPWLDFWDEADLACIETRAAQGLGHLSLAERRSRAALAAVRPEYSRNRASYLAQRAEVLAEQQNIEEAISTAAQAVEGASEVSSARIDARIGRVRAELSRYSDQPKVAEFLDWSGQIMTAKATGFAV